MLMDTSSLLSHTWNHPLKGTRAPVASLTSPCPTVLLALGSSCMASFCSLSVLHFLLPRGLCICCSFSWNTIPLGTTRSFVSYPYSAFFSQLRITSPGPEQVKSPFMHFYGTKYFHWGDIVVFVFPIGL